MTEPAFLTRTRESYSATAAEFAAYVGSDDVQRPLERALIGVFAELVRGVGGPVADVGCGVGQETKRLSELGLDAFGIDLAPGMVELARRRYPELRFEVGSMLGLDLPDASVGGVLAGYSIIHVPWRRRLDVFDEFFRVLTPGGYLLLIFQVGDDRGHRSEAFGKEISLDWYRQRPGEVAALLRQAGFSPWMQSVRQPEGRDKVPQGHMIVCKPQ